MLDFIHSNKPETGKSQSRVDFIQRGTANSDEISERASPDWTKSNEASENREKADFGWTKSNEAPPNPAQFGLFRGALGCRFFFAGSKPFAPFRSLIKEWRETA
ncbi:MULTISPECIES: hypothetical protein [Cohnella]|uniref:hypothetical protein n=1 Tax=Cohnella TaxID=329857 RepID=UPI001592C2BD|nr:MULTISPECIES: hypothetical protein [Cohnella]MBN2982884.1 hypothetical protein [Cohnella algarum]